MTEDRDPGSAERCVLLAVDPLWLGSKNTFASRHHIASVTTSQAAAGRWQM
jgi:hypothetical protein